MAPSHGNVCPNLNISHTHQPRQMHACRKRERGERKMKSGAVPKSSYLAYVRQKGCEKTIFLKFSSLPVVMYATSCKVQQRFSGTIILANTSSTSLSCTLRRMPMVGKPREICSIACEERETPASQYAVETESGFSRNILLPRASVSFLHIETSQKKLCCS